MPSDGRTNLRRVEVRPVRGVVHEGVRGAHRNQIRSVTGTAGEHGRFEVPVSALPRGAMGSELAPRFGTDPADQSRCSPRSRPDAFPRVRDHVGIRSAAGVQAARLVVVRAMSTMQAAGCPPAAFVVSRCALLACA